jgi:hypothetical protein
MSKLWVLKGDHEALGWKTLRSDHENEQVEIIHLDAKVWAIIRADEAPTKYEGLHAVEPEDGLYLDPNGSPLYLVGGEVVKTPEEVVAALGDEARQMMEKIGDAVTVIERMRRAF